MIFASTMLVNQTGHNSKDITIIMQIRFMVKVK